VKQRLTRVLFSALRVYLPVVLFVAVFQRRLLYVPETATEAAMLARSEECRLAPWRNEQGAIVGWKSRREPISPAANRLLVFHGNAGNALHRSFYVNGFESLDFGQLWEVRLFEYPGYGARPGERSRNSFEVAARQAIQGLMAEDHRPLFILGESIGSGVACEMAGRNGPDIAGLVLITPFARLAEVAQKRMPFMPAGLLLRDRWDNLAALRQTTTRFAMMIAGRDEVVSAEQGEKLLASYPGPKRRWLQPEATHNSLDVNLDAPWWREMSDFLLQK
jgi:uncharacterized protein